jgi:hypothetical protein
MYIELAFMLGLGLGIISERKDYGKGTGAVDPKNYPMRIWKN